MIANQVIAELASAQVWRRGSLFWQVIRVISRVMMSPGGGSRLNPMGMIVGIMVRTGIRFLFGLSLVWAIVRSCGKSGGSVATTENFCPAGLLRLSISSRMSLSMYGNLKSFASFSP
jgi:hypothetical protein